MIEEEIKSALTTVLPNVYPVILPRTPDYPAATYHRRDYSETNDNWGTLMLSTAEGALSIFQVVIYAETYTQAARLLRDVKQALETVPGLLLDSVQDGFEWQQNVFAIVTEWAVWGDLENEGTTDTVMAWNTLQPFTDAVLLNLTKTFSDRINTIRLHDPQIRKLITPALVLDVVEIEDGKTTCDDRSPVIVNFALHCLFPQSSNMIASVAGMTADIIGYLRYQKWGLGARVNMPENLQAKRAAVRPNAYGQWIITWQQMLYLGTEDDPVCTTKKPYSSYVPKTGTPHEKNYIPVVEPLCDG